MTELWEHSTDKSLKKEEEEEGVIIIHASMFRQLRKQQDKVKQRAQGARDNLKD